MWRSLSTAAVLATLSFAQEAGQGFGGLFQKAPPHIDQALRERVSHFYLMQQEGKSRRADSVVHEDSKDIFFDADKLKMRSFKIVAINYEDNHQKARVTTEIDTDMVVPGYGTMKVPRPVSSTWKFDAGEWWWYVNKQETRQTPFGVMSAGSEVTQSDKIDIGKLVNEQGVKLSDLQKKIQVDKTSIELSSHLKSSAEVTITSKFEGPVTLAFEAPGVPYVNYVLEQDRLEPGQSTKLIVACNPEGKAKKPDFRVVLTVEPLGRRIPIEVKFAYPPFDEPKPGTRVAVPAAPAK